MPSEKNTTLPYPLIDLRSNHCGITGFKKKKKTFKKIKEKKKAEIQKPSASILYSFSGGILYPP